MTPEFVLEVAQDKSIVRVAPIAFTALDGFDLELHLTEMHRRRYGSKGPVTIEWHDEDLLGPYPHYKTAVITHIYLKEFTA